MKDMNISNIINETIFQWTKVGYQNLISQRELTEVQLHDMKTTMERTMDGLLVGIHAYVLSHQLDSKVYRQKKTVVFEVPTTWWQHFKKDYQDRWWAPKWFRNYKRAKMVRDVTFAIWVHPRLLFPQARIPTPPNFRDPVFKYSTEEIINVKSSTIPSDNPRGKK